MKNKLSRMSVEEFFQHGFDSDSTNQDEEALDLELQHTIKKENGKGVKKPKLAAESIRHKSQLDRLKEKDPEFYKFLKENDEELLAFSGTDDDDDANEEEEEEDDDEEEINSTGDGDDEVSRITNIEEESGSEHSEDRLISHSNDIFMEEKGNLSDEASHDELSDSENDEELNEVESEGLVSKDEQKCFTEMQEEEGVEQDDVKEGKRVTMNMIKKWKVGLEEESLKTLKIVFRAFHAAVDSFLPEDEKKEIKSKSKYIVEGEYMFNNLVKMCLKYSVKILENHLSPSKKKKFTRIQLPSSNKLWSTIKMPLKQYLLDILQLLRTHTDVSVLKILLRHCHALCSYYACFTKIAKMFLKRLVRMWSSGEEHVRVLAFLCIRSLSILIPSLYEYILKKLYLGFVRNSKFVNLKTKPTVTFMKNSLVEMFSYNTTATYKHGFLYIRQLAITLRNAITVKKKDTFQTVYNWQYISCLQLWSQVVSELYGDTLKPLIYPIVQINLGVIRLIPAARYFPLRFHCIESLNYISKKTGVYIPTASFVLEAIESPEFLHKPKSSEKPPDYSGILKLTKAQLQTKGFQDCTIDLAVESMLEHYVIFSNSIAFPELIFPVCHRLRRLIKSQKSFKLSKDMKVLIDKLQAHADIMKKARDEVTFAPKDLELVRKWEEERKLTKTVLGEFLDTWKCMKKLTETNQIDHGEEIATIPKKVSSKDRKRKANGSNDNDNKPSTIQKKNKEREREFDGEDIVEDYVFSDNDSE